MRFNQAATSALLYSFYYATVGNGASTSGHPNWKFVQNGTIGITVVEAIVVSDTLVLTFDRAQHNPMMINNHSAWAALWNMETNTATPLNAVTDSFCGSGSILSNGSMVGR
jgi:hypothetical protein